MHNYINLVISQSFQIATRTCICLYKVYNSSSVLNLPSSISSRFIFLFKNLDELFQPPVLSGNPTPILNASFMALLVAKYKKEDLQHIFKMVLEV